MTEEVGFNKARDPEWEDMVKKVDTLLDDEEENLSGFEKDFLKTMQGNLRKRGANFALSERQEQVWNKIVKKFEEAGTF